MADCWSRDDNFNADNSIHDMLTYSGVGVVSVSTYGSAGAKSTALAEISQSHILGEFGGRPAIRDLRS